jgi:adenine-specific DNA-methyltransferase
MQLFEHVKEVLSKNESFCKDGKLFKNNVVEAALKLDAELLTILLKDDTTKKHFFTTVEGVQVFDKVKFQQFVSNKQFLPDSYTTFKNKIGLTANGEYLTEANEVVLDFPYKDCVLEGGQTKEDQKRKEIFWNETLAGDEIDRLFEPKVLTNWKKYDSSGESVPSNVSKKDNLIIKGNNLISAYSTLDLYRGQIKLVYLDPPYNTSGAANTFSYNNTFNHSTWLTFMKNRLEIARKLLNKEGVIAVSIDNEEVFYLGVLMDQVFGRENRLGVIAVVHNPGGRQDDQFFPSAHEHLLVYARNKEHAKINTLGISDKKLKEYKEEDKFGKYKLRGFRRSGSNSLRTERPKLFYPIYVKPDTNEFSLEPKKGFQEILPIDDKGVERCWRWGSATFSEKFEKYIEFKQVKGSWDIYTKERESDYEGEKAKSFWLRSEYTGQTGTNELKNTFGKKVFSYPKSPYFMRDVIQVLTNEGDIVIDFFAGSGTTGVVAHKLKRQYILIEQLEYIEPIPVSRLVKTIQGDQSGISTEVSWKGGGSFVYAELAENAASYISKIEELKSSKDAVALWNELKEEPFISYRVSPSEFDANIDSFEQLELDDQKKLLISTIDKNHLYINYADIEDKTYNISDGDKKLNLQFYNQ